jgi:hypothetical protein
MKTVNIFGDQSTFGRADLSLFYMVVARDPRRPRRLPDAWINAFWLLPDAVP